MSKPPVTVPIDYTVEETAKQLLDNKISGVPVFDSSGRIAGAITQTDLFNAMISLTGVGIGGCPRMPFSQTLRYAKKIILGILTICLR